MLCHLFVMSETVKRVSVVSTGTVSIRPEHVGPTRKSMYWWLLTSRKWTEPLPINVYVIEHRDGLVLFDTGQDRASVTDPGYFPGGAAGVIFDRLARFDVGPHETLTARLAALGHDIADVRTAVISHLHQDHIGGLRELGGAELLISRREWDTLAEPAPGLRGLLRSHIELPGLRWKHLDVPEQGYDLFGDGSLTLLATPGHTPGSLSMLVRRPGRAPLLMVGDLTYDDRRLRDGRVPGVGSRRQLVETTAAVNELRRQYPGLVILPAHDPGAAARLATAEGVPDETAEGVPGARAGLHAAG
jgi:N-acyl homoserine lactone hydrolase